MFRENYHQIERMLQACTGEEEVLLTTGGDHADLASTIAFKLAKKQKRAPNQIAGDIAERLAADPDLGDIQVEAVGPYINFRFGPSLLAQAVREALEPGYGKLPRSSERVVLEHTSANPNGPLHVGHIRNTVIGDSLARAFRKAGHPWHGRKFSPIAPSPGFFFSAWPTRPASASSGDSCRCWPTWNLPCRHRPSASW